MSTFDQKTAQTAPAEHEFSPKEYAEVWESLLEMVGESEYFNGKITTTHQGFCSELTTTIIIYRNKHHPQRPICDIVPIWWQMATFANFDNEGNLGEEHPNDFEFYTLREFAKQTNP